MARRCPGCGKIHSRKICPHCLYTPFQEEEFRVPGSREWGEIREAPPPRDPRRVSTLPQWQKRTAPQRRAYTRRKGKAVSGLVVFIMLLSMLPAILGAAFSILENVISDITYSHSERETVPSRLTLPENGLTLCDEGGLTLVLDWPGGPIEGDLRVLAQNESGMDLIASTDGVAINGCMVPDAFFYCDVRDQGLTEANFWIDMDSLSHTYGITEIHSLQLTLQERAVLLAGKAHKGIPSINVHNNLRISLFYTNTVWFYRLIIPQLSLKIKKKVQGSHSYDRKEKRTNCPDRRVCRCPRYLLGTVPRVV